MHTEQQGAKVGLYKKCYGEKQTGQIFNLLGIIDNIEGGEYLLPPGDKDDQFAKVREAANGYKILGTTYTYNAQNQLTARTNYVRDEVHPYAYDDRGNLTSNGRIEYTWNAQNQLVNVLFPDGEGVKYTYDLQGRRSSRTTYNAKGEGQHVTTFEYEGNSWDVLREKNKDGEITAAYTYDLQGRPLTIAYGGAVYWYVFNAHGDVVALTDLTGKVAARYEYDEWGRLFAMYDGEGNQVKEGYGNIGDIGTGPTRPATGKPTPGTESVKGNAKKSTSTTVESTATEEPVDEPSADELYAAGVIGEPDELVKANPYRYAGYRYDRETQYYYLRARYYDARTERFLSQDTWPGDVTKPLTLNRYIYSVNNPASFTDPTGKSAMKDAGQTTGLKTCLSYSGPAFYAPVSNPGATRMPNETETLFIQYVLDVQESQPEPHEYGTCTQSSVRRFQVGFLPSDKLDPIGSVEIGPITWDHLTEKFNAKIAGLATSEAQQRVQEELAEAQAVPQATVGSNQSLMDALASQNKEYPGWLTVARESGSAAFMELTACQLGGRSYLYCSQIADAARAHGIIDYELTNQQLFSAQLISEAGGTPFIPAPPPGLEIGLLMLAQRAQSKVLQGWGPTSMGSSEPHTGFNLYGPLNQPDDAEIHWGNWGDYNKVVVNGQEYAEIGGRLYSRHAVDRMQPSGNRYGHPITQAGGDYGRSVPPSFVEYVIRTAQPVTQENGNLSYTSGSLQVITNSGGAVVTVIIK